MLDILIMLGGFLSLLWLGIAIIGTFQLKESNPFITGCMVMTFLVIIGLMARGA